MRFDQSTHTEFPHQPWRISCGYDEWRYLASGPDGASATTLAPGRAEYEKTKDAVWNREYAKAAELLAEAARLDPEACEYWYQLGAAESNLAINVVNESQAEAIRLFESSVDHKTEALRLLKLGKCPIRTSAVLVETRPASCRPCRCTRSSGGHGSRSTSPLLRGGFWPTSWSGGSCPASDYMSLYDLSVFDVTGLVQSGDGMASIRLVTRGDCYSVVAIALAVESDETLAAEPSALDRLPAVDPLRVVKRPGATLELTWEDRSAPEYQVFRGQIGSYYSHAPELCGLLLPRADLAMSETSDYFLVVAATCKGGVSSCGRDSFGIERPGTMEVSGTECP